jgi:hypothetical protein
MNFLGRIKRENIFRSINTAKKGKIELIEGDT